MPSVPLMYACAKNLKFGSAREQIDSHGFDFYDEVPAIYEEKGIPMTFETKTGPFLIEGELSSLHLCVN